MTPPTDETTPRSFFFHSPPESPVTQPTSSSKSPFAHFTGTVSSFASRARSSSESRNAASSKNASPRPKSSQSHGRERRKGRASDEDSFVSRPASRFTMFPTQSQPNVNIPSSHFNTDSKRRRPGSSLFATASEVFLPRAKVKTSRSRLRPVQDDDLLAEEVLDISPAQQLRFHQGPHADPVEERAHVEADLPPIPAPWPTKNLPPPPIVIDGPNPGSNNPSPRFASIPIPDRFADASPRHSSTSLSHPRSTFEGPAIRHIPPFPTSYGKILNSVVRAAPLPRYTSSNNTISHLLPRSRSWKSRLICLTNFQVSPTSTAAFLHTFKSQVPTNDNIELDRLEISEDSVVFVSDEDIGGRRHVLRVGGLDRGPNGKDRSSNSAQDHQVATIAMWLLHITNQGELHNWISIIKTMITSRSTDVVGLGLAISPSRSSTATTSSPGPGDADSNIDLRVNGLAVDSPGIDGLGVNGLGHSVLPPISPISPLDVQSLGMRAPHTNLLKDTRSESDLRLAKRDSTMLKLRGFFSSSSGSTGASKDRPISMTLRRESSADTLSNHSPNLRLSFKGPTRTLHPSEPKLTRLSTHFEDSEGLSSAGPSSARSQRAETHSTEQRSQGLATYDNQIEDPGDEEDNLPQQEAIVKLTSLHSFLHVELSPQPPETPAEEYITVPLSQPPEQIQEPPRQSSEFIETSPPNSGQRSERASRIRYSAMLPELTAPPSGPLPPPPPPLQEAPEPRRDSTTSNSSNRHSDRTSNGSYTNSQTNRTVAGPQRLSSLFANRPGVSSNRVSMPPPPKPPPNFAPPPTPRPESADAVQLGIAKKKTKRESTLPPNMQYPSGGLPPISLPPLGPLPPIPSSPLFPSPDSPQVDRTSHRLAKTLSVPRVTNPFGLTLMNWAEEDSTPATPSDRQVPDNFLEVFTPVSQMSPNPSFTNEFPPPSSPNGIISVPPHITNPRNADLSNPPMTPTLWTNESTTIRSSTSVL